MAHVNLFLTENLTAEAWSRYGRLATWADRCWALKVFDGMAALQALEDGRWCRETVMQMELVEANLGRWAYALARDQTGTRDLLSVKEQALLAHGIEMRLLLAAMAESCVQRVLDENVCDARNLKIRLSASNPYLRDWARTRWGSALAGLAPLPGSRPVLQAARERLAGSVSIRRLSLSRVGRWSRTDAFPPLQPGSSRTAAAFILNQRYLDLFQPIRRELEERGWSVPVYCYNPLSRPCPGVVAFSELTVQVPVAATADLEKPAWVISDEVMARCPVSQPALRCALDASWVTARALVAQHLSALAALRPAVVISFGPEIMSLSLQAAAEGVGIPSLFLNHTFREPARSSCFLQASASSMAGPDCVELNRWDLQGQERKGMVATGHPPYDALLRRSVECGTHRMTLPHFSVPAHRPYLVLALTLWSNNLLWHAMQRKALQMVADALPSDAFLICKLHPSWEDRELPEAILETRLPKDAFRIVGESEYGTPDLLAACHVAVVHEQSMSLSDTVVMGRPAIAISHPEFPYGRYTMNHPAWGYKGAWQVVSDVAELRQALVTLTRDDAARAALLKHRRTYIERFLTAADGQSSRRVADLTEHLAVGRDTASFVAQIGPALIGH